VTSFTTISPSKQWPAVQLSAHETVASCTTISSWKQWPAVQPPTRQSSGQLYNHQLVKAVASCTSISSSKQWPAVQPSAHQSSGQLYTLDHLFNNQLLPTHHKPHEYTLLTFINTWSTLSTALATPMRTSKFWFRISARKTGRWVSEGMTVGVLMVAPGTGSTCWVPPACCVTRGQYCPWGCI
jgi:hypothetical protein